MSNCSRVRTYQGSVSADWLLDPLKPPIAGGHVHIHPQTGKIASISSRLQECIPQKTGSTFLTPGLINAHTHLELHAETPIPLKPGETIADWILQVVAHSRSQTEADKVAACRQGVKEMLETGTTCVNDITSTGASITALSETGMRGQIALEFFHPRHNTPLNMASIREQLHNLTMQCSSNRLLTLALSPHSPYNVAPAAWEAILRELDPIAIHTHLAETREEMRWFAEGQSALDTVHEQLLGQRFGPLTSGTSPLDFIRHLVSSRWSIAHGVYLSQEDLHHLAKHGAGLVHCPRSNLHLSQETLPLLQHLQETTGIPVGLGTDSRMSSPDLDLRSEGRVAQACHHLSAQEVLALMTAGSASSMGYGNRVGPT
jgi:cytosine/adenosine deaminase-related metal-dependent hydrolase